MIYYVTTSNLEEAETITRELQTYDTDNMYISPLITFSHLTEAEADIMTLRLDLMTMLLNDDDKILVASQISPEMEEEINLARRLGLEVEFL